MNTVNIVKIITSKVLMMDHAGKVNVLMILQPLGQKKDRVFVSKDMREAGVRGVPQAP